MSEVPLRAGVIGLGAMGENHARVYGDMPDVELVAVADIDPARIERVTRGRTVRGYGDFGRMLDEEQLDLVSLAVPTRSHLEAGLRCIERGVAVLIEKPLAATLDEGRAAARRGGRGRTSC